MMDRSEDRLPVPRRRGRKADHLLAAGWLATLAATAPLVAMFLWPHARWLPMAALALLAVALLASALGWHQVHQQIRDHGRMLRQLHASERQAIREATARRQLLAAVSHELRTPLNGLLGTLALLRGTSLNAEQQNHVQTLDTSARMLLSMVDELLERASLEEAGSDTLETRPFDVARLVEETCELLAPRAHARGLEIAAVVAPQVRGHYLGDPLRLKQVLLNLLGNAVKFTAKGGVLVRVEAVQGRLRFAVEDTGPGVPPALEQRLFDAYVRDAASDIAREGGAGLGLAICRRLVRRMGGTLCLDNQPGRGARFHFTLPLRQADTKSANSEAACATIPRLLLLAPDGPVRRALAEQAAACGAVVHLTDKLPPYLPCDGDVIVDARLEQTLPALLARTTATPALRVWLLLRPEDRIRLHDWLHDPRLSGYLLRPVRRHTFFKLLSESGLERMTDRAVLHLRQMQDVGGKKPRQAPPLVVLAEDDAVSARVAQALLERIGCRVLHVADGESLVRVVEELLRQPRQEHPAAVLLDVHMPVLDGMEAAQAIRRLEARLGTPRLPLLALSAGGEEDRARCLAAGMDGFLRKPVEPEALSAALMRYMNVSSPANAPIVSPAAVTR